MPLYAFKIIEKMLTHHEQENEPKPSQSIFPSTSKQGKSSARAPYENKTTSGHKNKNQKNHEKNVPDNSKAYCLFANSGQSFLAMYGGEKKTIFLNGISHPSKFHPLAKQANSFINENIKGKNVFINVTDTLDSGELVADVFLDMEKTRSLNHLLIQEGFDKSQETTPMTVISEAAEISDMKELKHQDVTSATPSSVKPKQKNSFEHAIGYLVQHGYAPYQHQEGASKSYFLELEVNGEKQTRWGIDFARAIKAAKVKNGDYIELKKTDNPAPNGSKRVSWDIIKKEGINDLQKKHDGPPVVENTFANLDGVHELVFEAPDDWTKEEPINWEAQEPIAFLGDIIPETSANIDDEQVQEIEVSHLDTPISTPKPSFNLSMNDEPSPFDEHYIPVFETELDSVGMNDMPEPPDDIPYDPPYNYEQDSYDYDMEQEYMNVEPSKKAHRI